MVLFNTTSADIKTKSGDVVLKSITILKEMRIAQLSSQNDQLKSKHCRKPYCRNGVVNTIRPTLVFQCENMKNSKLHWFLALFLLEAVKAMDVTFSQIQGPLPMNIEKPF